MNARLDIEVLGWLLAGLGVFQLAPVAAALAYGEPATPFVASALVALVFGLSVALSTRQADRRMRPRDGFFVVVGSWVLASVFGALPFELSDRLSFVDALFESVAGFTTTGSTVMSGLDGSSRALLLWRSISQWLGGMGIIVFAIAILPLLGVGGMQLFRAEVPGPVTDKLTPRIAVTARRLWLVYAGYTLLEWALLWGFGMGAFDALCHALTTMATGGFSTRDASLGAFGSPAIEWTVVVFMAAAGVNFVLHYHLLLGRPGVAWRDRELRFFVALVLGAIALVAWQLRDQGPLEPVLRAAAFQVVSLVTTTGYTTADFDAWPPLARLVLVHLMIVGGMAGSTAGGMKCIRVLLGLRWLRISVERGIHPRSVQRVKHAGRPVPEPVLAGVATFVIAYFAIASLAAAAVAAEGHDLVTAATTALTAIGNVGPGLGAAGPSEIFADFSAPVKLVMCFCMIAGRLEIFTLLVLLRPEFWRR